MLKVTPHLRIKKLGEHRMVLSHFEHDRAYAVAERPRFGGKWNITPAHENIVQEHTEAGGEAPKKHPDATADDRNGAVDALHKIALTLPTPEHPKAAFSVHHPFIRQADGTKLRLRQHP